MITIYDLKPRFQNLLRPLCRWLAGLGVTANQVTVAAMAISIVVGALFALNPTAAWAAFLLPVTLFVRMALPQFEDDPEKLPFRVQTSLATFTADRRDVDRVC